MGSLPKDALGLDQLLDELAPDLRVTALVRPGQPASGRVVATEEGDHSARIWRHDSRWWLRSILETPLGRSTTPPEELRTTADLAWHLAKLLMLNPPEPEAYLRERTGLMAAEREAEEDQRRRAQLDAEEDAAQAAYEAAHPDDDEEIEW